jgi:hypothetical protein
LGDGDSAGDDADEVGVGCGAAGSSGPRLAWCIRVAILTRYPEEGQDHEDGEQCGNSKETTHT